MTQPEGGRERVELSDGRILLRRYSPEDVEPLYEAVRESVAELTPWMPWCTENYTRKESRDWVLSRDAAWAEDEEYSFVVADQATGRFLGGAGLNAINSLNNFANLGYWVRSGSAGQGVATAAACLVARWGLLQMGFQRVEILAATGNVASRRVAQKAGAVEEGILRNRIRVHGRVWDAVIFSLIPSDVVPAF